MPVEPKTAPVPKTTAVLVLNNREAAHGIQLAGEKGAGGVIRPGPLLQLVPGWNIVDAVQWEAAKKNSMVQVYMRERIAASKAPEQNPECVGKRMLVEGPVVDPSDPLGGMEQEKAVEIVGEIFVVKRLRHLLETEKRPVVAQALRDQLAAVDKNPGTKARGI